MAEFSQQSNLILKRFKGYLSSEVVESFTDEQWTGIQSALRLMYASSTHQVDIREQISFFGRKYYIVFLFGKERRKSRRVHRNSAMTFKSQLARYTCIGLAGVLVLEFAICSLYFLGVMLGINLFSPG